LEKFVSYAQIRETNTDSELRYDAFRILLADLNSNKTAIHLLAKLLLQYCSNEENVFLQQRVYIASMKRLHLLK